MIALFFILPILVFFGFEAFDIKKCGFKDIGCGDLDMDRTDIKNFVKRTEDKTKTQIIDLRG